MEEQHTTSEKNLQDIDEQHTASEKTLQDIAEYNKKLRKKLLITLGIAIGIVAVLLTVLLIINACQEKEDEAFSLPDSYFYPTYRGDIFEYIDYLEKRPDVIFYCEDPNGVGRTTSIDEDREEEFTPEVLYLRDFIKIMMHADVDAYNDCFNEIYYKTRKKQADFSQQMIYEAEIRFISEETAANGTKTSTYYLLYKLYQNDGSLRRDVGSDAVVPMRIVLRTTPAGEISISEWATTRTN